MAGLDVVAEQKDDGEEGDGHRQQRAHAAERGERQQRERHHAAEHAARRGEPPALKRVAQRRLGAGDRQHGQPHQPVQRLEPRRLAQHLYGQTKQNGDLGGVWLTSHRLLRWS